MKKNLLVIGDSGVRLRLEMDCLPYAGEKRDGTRYAYSPDCLAGAAAACAVKMDIGSVILTKVGNDANGTKLLNVLSQKGVDVRYAVRDKSASTCLTVIVDEDAADMRMVRYRGAAGNLTPDEVEEAFTCYPDAVLLRLETNRSAAEAAYKFASEKEIDLYVSAVETLSADDAYLPPKMKTFIGDARSVLTFTGIAPSNPDSALRAAFELSRKIEADYIIFRMNNGCIYVYDGKFGRILDQVSKGHFFSDVFAPALIAEYLKCGNTLAASRFALQAVSLWEACGETLNQIPTASEVRRDADGI